MPLIDEIVTQVVASQERLVQTVSGLDDARMREPSLLPGWTRGHVANHIARNAESYWRLLEWARTGVEHPQYPSPEARVAGIEAGAGHSAATLLADITSTNALFVQQVSLLPEAAWDATVRATAGWGHPAWYTLYRRWREVEIHHVDLNAGYTPADWPSEYVRWELRDSLTALGAKAPVSQVIAPDIDLTVQLDTDGPVLEGEGRTVLGWLTGRATDTGIDLPAPTWPGPYAPAV